MNDSQPVVFQHGQTFLATISERWNYQILREVFFGTARFGELKRALGISANILTTRLNALTELGLLTRRAYREDKQWFEYELSDAARELVVPAIVAITRWAEERGPDPQAAGAARAGRSCTPSAARRPSPTWRAASVTSRSRPRT